MQDTLSQKVYLELKVPDGTDNTADKERIERALEQRFGKVIFPMETFIQYYSMLRDFDWKLTVSLVWTGDPSWQVVKIEEGDTRDRHFGYAADLGSTTISMQLVDLNTGHVLGEETTFNNQIAFGEDILSRIFYTKGNQDHLMEIKACTLDNFKDLMGRLEEKTGIASEECIVLTIGGNTAMIHFLFGVDPWTIFHTPYTPSFNNTGFVHAKYLDLPFNGLVYAFPSIANYLGGDVVSGILASDMMETEELSLYIDIGTNGEMALGNKNFLITIAGSAGPALEGGISEHGMQAKPGAVDTVKIRGNELILTTIEDEKPKGICGSGIVDLIAEMFLEGWIDFSGNFDKEKSDRIVKRSGELAVVYAWDHESANGSELRFTQTDMDMYLDTKAAMNVLLEYLIERSGADLAEIKKVYLAGSFGKHLNLESAITIGLYPDIPREHYVRIGNGSLLGAYKLLLYRNLLTQAKEMHEITDYLQLEEESDFLTKMYAAKFLPHTNLDAYPSVMAKLAERRKNKRIGC